MIAQCNMIALCPRTATLAFLDTGQLFQLAMEALHIPPYIVPAANDGCCEILCGIIRDNPVNVAVFGDYLEEPDEKGYFLEFDQYPSCQTLLCPFNRLEMDIARLLAETYQPIGFQRRREDTTLSVDVFQIVGTCIPRIK